MALPNDQEQQNQQNSGQQNQQSSVPNMNNQSGASTQAPQPANVPGQPAAQNPQQAQQQQAQTPQFRQASGNSSVSRLMNFAKANQGNTQGMANQMSNAFNSQVNQAAQNMSNYKQGDATNQINHAANQAQNIYNMAGSLGNQQGMQNFAQAALGTNNQFRSGIDNMLLGTNKNAISSLQNNAMNQGGNILGKLNQYTQNVGGGNFENFNAGDFAQKMMPKNMSQYYQGGQNAGDEYGGDYNYDMEGQEQAGGGFMGSLQGAAQGAMLGKLGQSNPMLAAALGGQNMMANLQAGNKVGAADAGVGMAAGTMFGPAGGMAYNMIPESARQQAIGTGMKGYEKLGMNTDFMNVNDPKAALKATMANAMGGKYVGGLAKKAVAKTAQKAASSVLCHAQGTVVLLDDGSYKRIEDVKLGDKLMLGGLVIAKGQAYAPEDMFIIDGVLASGKHALMTDGYWGRLHTNIDARFAEGITVDYVYPLVTENHLMVTVSPCSDNVLVWADMDEISDTYNFTDEQIIDILNQDTDKKKLIEEYYAYSKNLRQKRL